VTGNFVTIGAALVFGTLDVVAALFFRKRWYLVLRGAASRGIIREGNREGVAAISRRSIEFSEAASRAVTLVDAAVET
jgi:hypothetical protein